MAFLRNMKDGLYEFSDVVGCLEKPFKSEKDFCDYIELNIELFCNDILGVSYLSHKREYIVHGGHTRVNGVAHKIKGTRKIDFVIKSIDGQIIGVECKDPFFESELINGIGQILSYLAFMELNEKPANRIILLSTSIHPMIPHIIRRFSLPIEYIVMDKNKSLTWRADLQNIPNQS